MDAFTQGLLGGVTAQLGFRQKIGRDATMVAVVVGLVSDLDVFAGPLLSLTGAEVDDFTGLRTHRAITHSLLAAPVFALVIAAIWWHFRRRVLRNRHEAAAPRIGLASHPEVARLIESHPAPPQAGFGWLYACVLVAYLSHPLLDWCTSYGTQLFAPLTEQRYAFDAMPIIDIFYTPILILTLLACYLVRKTNVRRQNLVTLIVGWAGFMLSVGYIGAGRHLHNQAIAQARPLAQNEQIIRANAYPGLGSIFTWRVVIETSDRWIAARVRPLRQVPPQQLPQSSAPKVDNQYVQQARQLDQVQTFDWFAMYRLRATYRRLNGNHVVEFLDTRYGFRPEKLDSLWGVRVTFDGRGEVLEVERVQHTRDLDWGQLLRRALQDALP